MGVGMGGHAAAEVGHHLRRAVGTEDGRFFQTMIVDEAVQGTGGIEIARAGSVDRLHFKWVDMNFGVLGIGSPRSFNTARHEQGIDHSFQFGEPTGKRREQKILDAANIRASW